MMGAVGAWVWVKPSKVRGTISRKPHIVASGEWSRRHDPSKGRIGRLGVWHAKENDKVGFR